MRPKHKRLVTRAWRWLRPVVVVVVVTCALRSAVADWNDVPTGSMNPTIVEGDRVFVNKLAYDLKVPFTSWRLARWSGPQRGDIVTFYSPADGKRLIKRVIGLPGDLIEMRYEELILNGQPVPIRMLESAGAATDQRWIGQEGLPGREHPVQVTPAVAARRNFAPLRVPPGQYFVMGDNRDRSFDSRYFGCVHADRITGKALAVAISVDRENWYLPRWRRFFTPLP